MRKNKQKYKGWGTIRLDRRYPTYFYQPPLDRLPKLRTLLLDIYEYAKEDYDEGFLYYIPNYWRLRKAGLTAVTAKRYLQRACQEGIFYVVRIGAHCAHIYRVGEPRYRRFGPVRSFYFNYKNIRRGMFKNWVER